MTVWISKILIPAKIGLILAIGLGGSGFQQTEGLPHAFEVGWRGQKVCELLFENESVRVGRCTFPPGVGHEKHFHRPHFGYALTSNKMQIRDSHGVRESQMEAGATWSTDSMTVHEALNAGETTAVYLIVEPKK